MDTETSIAGKWLCSVVAEQSKGIFQAKHLFDVEAEARMLADYYEWRSNQRGQGADADKQSKPKGDLRPDLKDDREQCDKCGRKYPCWFAPNDIFNKLVPSGVGMWCPLCFMELGKDVPNLVWVVGVAGDRVYHTSACIGTADLTAHDREVAARALREAAEGLDNAVITYKNGSVVAGVQVWLRARAAAIAEGR